VPSFIESSTKYGEIASRETGVHARTDRRTDLGLIYTSARLGAINLGLHGQTDDPKT